MIQGSACRNFLLLFAGACLLLYLFTTIRNYAAFSGWLLMLFFLVPAVLFHQYPRLKGFSFTVTIFAAVSLAMYYLQYFISAGSLKLAALIIPLLQVIIFGMGSELSLPELLTVLKKPKGIIAGVICYYTIMPLVGFTIVTLFDFPKEIAAGIILVGCCASELASGLAPLMGGMATNGLARLFLAHS